MGNIVKEQTTIDKLGLMDVEKAAICLGVKLSYFKLRVSPFIGRYIGGKKYFTESELEQWLREQIGEPANITKAVEN